MTPQLHDFLFYGKVIFALSLTIYEIFAKTNKICQMFYLENESHVQGREKRDLCLSMPFDWKCSILY